MALVSVLGVFAAALFYGDSMITPAISVLSAVEGLEVAAPQLHQVVVPLTMAILVVLFMIQRHGTARIGVLFGPVMTLWFTTLAVLGIQNIAQAPHVLWALSPHYAVAFMMEDGMVAFLALGSVVLAVTGAEALYTDMGHFGRLPIRLAWYLLVLPALMLNYFGQGALLLTHPDAVESPFFHLGPDWAGIPLVMLATSASVIASQAVISGAFSVTRQAIQLGYLPRMSIVHTSETGNRADLHPGPELDAGRVRDGARAGLPDVEQSRFRLWHRRDRHHDHRYRADSAGDGPAVAVAGQADGAADRLLPDHRSGVLPGQFHQDPAWRLVPADHRHRDLRAADHLEPRAGACCRAGLERDAIPAEDFLQKRVAPDRAGSGNGNLPGERDRRRAAVAASQPEAQPRPARARRPAERHHRGGAPRAA